MGNFFRRPWIAIFVCLIHGCTTMTPLQSDGNPANFVNQLKVGDVVRIKMVNGHTFSTKITHLTEERILGKKVNVAVSDISQIEVKRVDEEKVHNIGLMTFILTILAIISIKAFIDIIF